MEKQILNRQVVLDKTRDVLFENKVVILFSAVTLFAFFASGMSTVMFFSELFTRFGRNTFLVLSLLIPVVAGLGLNFGIVIGAMAAQIAVFLIVLWGGQGVFGVAAAATVAVPLAVIFGLLIGKLFNAMKGSEMVGGMVTALFADGFYQFFFLFIMGGVITVANARLVTPTGVGVVNSIDLHVENNMRQALDNISMLTIVTIAFWIMLAFVAGLVLFKLVKKQPLKIAGAGGLKKPLVVFVPLAVIYGVSFVVEPFLYFLYQDRLMGLTAVRLVAVGMGLAAVYKIVYAKLIEKLPGLPTGQFGNIIFAGIIFAVTLGPNISNGLSRVRVPVFTYLLIVGLCFFIQWFMGTRLGQNMRTVGHDRAVAATAGINVDRTRIIAMILSTLLAAWGQIISMQNFGVMQTYGAHSQVGVFAIAALLVGGASVSRATVKHALLGVILFHSLFILAPIAGRELMGSALIGEYFRVFVANAVIAFALIMHAWKRAKSRKVSKPPAAVEQRTA
ncbi:MAG: ABC transporter permease [Spirochaetes bacterium]|nr:ABC transporter permease [Spirochaetota bacterium]